jgi:ribonuclease HI
MVVWVSSNSNYVRQGITNWIHKWKRNGWKIAKKGGAANATLWRELDSAVARQRRLEFTSVRAHSGILLNECGDQSATRALGGSSYGPEIVTPLGEAESEEEFVMQDADATQLED